MKKRVIDLSKNSCSITILSELLNVIPCSELKKRTGEQSKNIEGVLRKIKSHKGKEVAIELWEINLIKRAFDEVAKKIEEWEFGLRIGEELDEVEKMPVLNDELPEKTVVELYQNLPIINILSEICYDSPVRDFENKLGVKEKDAQALLDRLLDDVEKEVNEIYLEDWEVDLITNALAEVKKTIPAEEFSKRIGMKIGEVEALPIFKETR